MMLLHFLYFISRQDTITSLKKTPKLTMHMYGCTKNTAWRNCQRILADRMKKYAKSFQIINTAKLETQTVVLQYLDIMFELKCFGCHWLNS